MNTSDLQVVEVICSASGVAEPTTHHAAERPERRRAARFRPPFHARLGTRSEHVTAPTEVVDLSESGVLLVSAEPLGARADDRVCLTLITPTGNIHRLGRVVRTARGDDFRSYVAVEFVDPSGDELARALEDHRHRTA